MNWNTNRIKYGGMQMFMKLGTGTQAKEKGKIVMLCHDIAYRKHELTGGLGQKRGTQDVPENSPRMPDMNLGLWTPISLTNEM